MKGASFVNSKEIHYIRVGKFMWLSTYFLFFYAKFMQMKTKIFYLKLAKGE